MSNKFYSLYYNICDESHYIESKKLGKILTIIDACIDDKDRVKYIKDLIKNSFKSDVYESRSLYDSFEGIILDFVKTFYNEEYSELEGNIVSKSWTPIKNIRRDYNNNLIEE